jgi:hypothetical protein
MIITRRELDKEHRRSIHTKKPATTPEEKRARLVRWKLLHRQGVRGMVLCNRVGMRPVVARRWAAELGFDMEGMA